MPIKHQLPRLQVIVMFEPNRLAPAYLQRAYGLLLLGPNHRRCAQPAPLSEQPLSLSTDQQKGDILYEELASGALCPRLL
jgi:hypothetical protein